jgi:Adenylate and Guanylate cyclase catalytic domain
LQVEFLGEGALLDAASVDTEIAVPLSFHFLNGTADMGGHCLYALSIFRTKGFSVQLEEKIDDRSSSLACILFILTSFVITALIFLMYDRFVKRRNQKIVLAAARSNAIISSLFPSQVRDRLFAAKDEKYNSQDYATPKRQLKTMIVNGEFQANVNADADDDDFMYKTKPIADLFPETTILFADIAGFTAWSSVREPTQVFILLETLYRAFDEIAKRRRVFKVETVGDCYVAVTGLPDPRKDHAIAMSRFARECMLRMQVLVRKLEVTLGPDTGDLVRLHWSILPTSRMLVF